MQVNEGGISYQFYWATESAPSQDSKAGSSASEVTFGGVDQPGPFLRRMGQMGELRELLRRGTIGVFVWMDDEAVLKRLADEITKKRLRVMKRVPTGGGGSPSSTSTQRIVVPRRQAPSEQSSEAEAATFSSNHDGEAQAAALVTAAEDGLAVCEECERRRAQG